MEQGQSIAEMFVLELELQTHHSVTVQDALSGDVRVPEGLRENLAACKSTLG